MPIDAVTSIAILRGSDQPRRSRRSWSRVVRLVASIGATRLCQSLAPPQATMSFVPKLITLDSTGTLIRVSRPIGEVYRDALLSVAPSLRSQVPAAEGLTHSCFQALKVQSAKAPCFGADTPGGCRQWWHAVVRNTFVDAGMPQGKLQDIACEEAFVVLYDDYFAGNRAWEVLPTTASALADLRRWCDRKGCRLGVLSNMDERLPKILETLDISHFFDFILTSYSFGVEKPSVDIFNEARRLAGISGSDLAFHVGDSTKRDVVGAQTSGFGAMLIDNDADALQDMYLSATTDGVASAKTYRAPHIGHLLEILDNE